MTTYTATDDGIFICTLDDVKVMLSKCAAVQTFLGTSGPTVEADTLALLDVEGVEAPASNEGYTIAEMSALKPRVMISADSQFMIRIDSAGGFATSGGVEVMFYKAISTLSDRKNPRTVKLAMQTTMGRAADELIQQNFTDNAFGFSDITFIGPVIDDDDANSVIGAEVYGVLMLRSKDV
jgi:hypothetical protein